MEPPIYQENPESKALCQIQVDEDEMLKRISTLVARKQKETDELIVQEFFGRQLVSEDDPAYETIESCARTDAAVIPRFGGKSRIRISSIENRWGPQTNKVQKLIKRESGVTTLRNSTIDSVDERLRLMETHLKMEDSCGKNTFQRIRALEDKILYLEGMSPEYFNFKAPSYTSPKKKIDQEMEKLYSNWSVDDIQKKIQALKESLKNKSKLTSERKET